jgi:hypothetical protein
MTVAELISRSIAAATADRTWLGSATHLAVLEAALTDVFGVTDVSLVWIPPMQGTHWEPDSRVIRLEKPTLSSGATVEVLAAYTVMSVLHECLHIRYTTDLGAYPTRRDALPARQAKAAEWLFNKLEDAYVSSSAVRDDPTLEPYVAPILDGGVQQTLAAASPRGWGEGGAPTSQTEQLLMALEVYALRPSKHLTLRPAVKRRLEEAKETIDRVRTSTSEDRGLAAVDRVQAAFSSGLPN